MNTRLNSLLDVIQLAGTAVESIRRNGFTTSYKGNEGPLTEADLACNQILKQHLLKQFPEDGWLSEETIDDKLRLNKKYVWIVDPIDGTKEFVKGIDEYAISVALVEDGMPVIAAVFNSAKNELCYAQLGHGTYLNGKPVYAKPPANKPLTILASRTEMAKGNWEAFKDQCQIIAIGSVAYKLSLVARGVAHATFSLTPKSEWDVAAGVLLVQEAGGKVTNDQGKPLIFNQADTRLSGIIASCDDSYEQLKALIISTRMEVS